MGLLGLGILAPTGVRWLGEDCNCCHGCGGVGVVDGDGGGVGVGDGNVSDEVVVLVVGDTSGCCCVAALGAVVARLNRPRPIRFSLYILIACFVRGVKGA